MRTIGNEAMIKKKLPCPETHAIGAETLAAGTLGCRRPSLPLVGFRQRKCSGRRKSTESTANRHLAALMVMPLSARRWNMVSR